MLHVLRAMAIFFLAETLVSCGGGGSSGQEGDLNDISGVWKSRCDGIISSNGYSYSSIEEKYRLEVLTFSKSEYHAEWIYYQDADCITPVDDSVDDNPPLDSSLDNSPPNYLPVDIVGITEESREISLGFPSGTDTILYNVGDFVITPSGIETRELFLQLLNEHGDLVDEWNGQFYIELNRLYFAQSEMIKGSSLADITLFVGEPDINFGNYYELVE